MVNKVESLGANWKPIRSSMGSLKQTKVPVLKAGLVMRLRTRGGQTFRGFPVAAFNCWVDKDRAAVGSCGNHCHWDQNVADDLGRPVDEPVLAIHTATKVRIQTDASVIRTTSDTAGQAGLELRDSADLPATQQLARDVE